MVPALGNCFVEKNKTLFCHTLLVMDSFNIPCLPASNPLFNLPLDTK